MPAQVPATALALPVLWHPQQCLWVPYWAPFPWKDSSIIMTKRTSLDTHASASMWDSIHFQIWNESSGDDPFPTLEWFFLGGAFDYATLIKCVSWLRAVLNAARDGESLTCSSKSFHNEDEAETNDLWPQDLLVLILLIRDVGVMDLIDSWFEW